MTGRGDLRSSAGTRTRAPVASTGTAGTQIAGRPSGWERCFRGSFAAAVAAVPPEDDPSFRFPPNASA